MWRSMHRALLLLVLAACGGKIMPGTEIGAPPPADPAASSDTGAPSSDGDGETSAATDSTDPTGPDPACTHLPQCRPGDDVASSLDPCIKDGTCYPVVECGRLRLWCHRR